MYRLCMLCVTYLNFVLNVEHVACIQCCAFYGQHFRNSEVEVILFIKHIFVGSYNYEYKVQLVGLVRCLLNLFH